MPNETVQTYRVIDGSGKVWDDRLTINEAWQQLRNMLDHYRDDGWTVEDETAWTTESALPLVRLATVIESRDMVRFAYIQPGEVVALDELDPVE